MRGPPREGLQGVRGSPHRTPKKFSKFLKNPVKGFNLLNNFEGTFAIFPALHARGNFSNSQKFLYPSYIFFVNFHCLYLLVICMYFAKNKVKLCKYLVFFKKFINFLVHNFTMFKFLPVRRHYLQGKHSGIIISFKIKIVKIYNVPRDIFHEILSNSY